MKLDSHVSDHPAADRSATSFTAVPSFTAETRDSFTK
jgi:hypothetical protein